ncbi:MAG: flagellar biosynthesis protein FlhA [Candidatus Glassbacteria bacterium GWA2_58_10]|uniref:Flagellar biosynthesis protein FlhA n=1 Tax=Candidatus Glassbacteria bacterium GWA2_58_10 TaxID=1817865 RepID=A0A1F5YI85_9BACT|nr:MAG: flagellar biosynthesis protein FlhA [Candidatus Glassbacteria bacterium GWA2_58_10]
MRFNKYSDVMLALGLVGILVVMIIPIPPTLMDLVLTLDISLSLLILIVVLYTTEPLQFSVFPGLLLMVTLFRLSLNVATTRLILSEAYAGRLIEAFGTFVVGGNYVVGIIIFSILVIINFVVITKGAGRIAEVAARFTLDKMPGKQMAIDADLNNGLIDEHQARARREKIDREAEFYGAMDGAAKFVRGDAIAAILITFINVLGGFVIGVAQKGMSFQDAIKTYTLLTVGDGLVSQIPALVVSTAAGIIITRASSESHLGIDIQNQLMAKPRALIITASVLTFFGLVPGLPTIPFLILAGLVGLMAMGARSQIAETRKAEEEAEEKKDEAPRDVSSQIEGYLQVDPLELEIGYGLIPLVDLEQGGDLLGRITEIRKQCAIEIGIIVPPIRIRDNIQLKNNEYVIKIRGVDVSRGEVMVNQFMALDPGTVTGKVEGVPTVEQVFGLEALWINEDQKENAEMAGYTVVEPPAVLATHLMETLKRHAHEILSRQDTQTLLDNIKKENATLVEELIPNVMSVGSVQKVLHNLLRERVPIRDLVTILEALSDYAGQTKDLNTLTEYVRQNLSRTIFSLYRDAEGKVTAITLAPDVEKTIIDVVQSAVTKGSSLAMPPRFIERVTSALKSQVDRMSSEGLQPLLVCSPTVRQYFKRLVEPVFPNLVVISYAELPQTAEIVSFGTIQTEKENALR